MCLILLNAMSIFGQYCEARNSPVRVCATKKIPNGDPKFHHPVITDGAGRSSKALFATLIKGCLFRVALFINVCVVVGLLIC
jgi:hypothetical protein